MYNYSIVLYYCQNYQMVFDGQLGTITGYQASLQVKEGVQPRFIRARPVPFAWQQ